MTPWAEAKYKTAKPVFGPNKKPAKDSNDPIYRCFPPGVPRIYLHRRPMEIIQLPNEVIMMLQTTSLASIVTLIDITGAARTVNAQYYLPFEAYVTAGVFYLCLTFILVRLFKLAERRWLGYLAPRKA